MEILIRPMEISDYGSVLKLWKSCFRMIYTQDSRENLRKTLEGNPSSCLVAISGNRIIGSILGTYDSRSGYIYRFALEPDFRREGIGARLVNEAENALRERGARKIVSCCLENGKGLINHYEKMGYKKTPYCRMVKML